MQTFMLRCRPLLACALTWGMLMAAVAAPAGASTLYERSLELLGHTAKSANPADFSFVVMGDSQENIRMLRKVLRQSCAFKPLFILHNGDVTDGGTRTEFTRFLTALTQEAANVPVFVVRGNHERDPQLFREMIGPQLFRLDLPHLNFVLAAVDNSEFDLSEPARDFLKSAVASSRRYRFIAMHIPPYSTAWNWFTFTSGMPELLAMLSIHRPTTAFFSHVHQYARDNSRGYPMVVTGGAGASLHSRDKFPGEPVHHFLLVRVTKEAVTTRLVKVE